jgi:nitrite reductase/ring-hydroxylating ferredoxin subunit
MSDLDRRGFLTMAAGLCAACALGDTAFAAPGDTKPVDVGTLDELKAVKISDKYAKSNGFFLVNEEGKLVAISNKCSHKNFAIDVKGDGFTCPKHGSQFSIHGTVVKGQAKSTLPRYAISVKNGKVTVDPSRSFSEKQWEDKAAFVELPK